MIIDYDFEIVSSSTSGRPEPKADRKWTEEEEERPQRGPPAAVEPLIQRVYHIVISDFNNHFNIKSLDQS